MVYLFLLTLCHQELVDTTRKRLTMSKKVPKLKKGKIAKLAKSILLEALNDVGWYLSAMTAEELQEELVEGRGPDLVKVLKYAKHKMRKP